MRIAMKSRIAGTGIAQQTLVAACSIVALSANCVAPRQPDADALNALAADPWRAGDPTAKAGTSADELAWWRSFNDPVLADLADKAVAANLDLAAARQRIVQARARRGVTNADRLPRLDFEGSYAHAGSGEDALAFAAPPPGYETNLFAVGVVAGWEVDLWGRVQRLVDAADADTAAATEAYRDAAVSLLAEVALAYADARTLDTRLQLVERNVSLQERTLQLAQARFKAGNGPELDVTQSSRLLRRTQARVPELRRARTVAENRIAILLGERPRDDVIPPGELPRPTLEVNMGIPADLITRRPDIRRAAWAYRAALARTDAADLEHLPRLTLNGSIRLSADKVGDLTDQAFVYSFGPQLTFPLFDAHRIDANVRVKQSQAEEARLQLEQTLLAAIEEVENAAVGYARRREQISRLDQAVRAAERTAKLSEDLYRAGLRDLSQVIDAQRELVAVQDDLAVAQQDLTAQAIRLYRALGGGWRAIPISGAVHNNNVSIPPQNILQKAEKMKERGS